ncbi:NAD(P)-dependent dehydrogenase, short-chain alcohol dehydrogenase family [Dyadobacter koreensis]|uniref:NAD(P)-dependent dehydrogenase, short-chain alcohol dehydrogenase family n=1 Tax=Dyadobacter koreensis TaxID=408657 RepID=A0A1H6UMP6_9BACT|nr:oxidoreductase [Dyadobacter koreensis]SEI91994.1 NAD(P)-dependent dehydrogenase, short-chain alcohol dehydrogenase family [Dyadobacter koreensis]
MWTKENIPDQSGKTALITGANTGLGYEIAKALYEAGAHVILASRDEKKTNQATENILALPGKGAVESGILDLANLGQVRKFAEMIMEKHSRLDLLINNAGVMTPPESKTNDGYELQFGVNFLGHFALTGHLFPLLKKTVYPRVVTVSSGAHKMVKEIDFDNLRSEKSYDANREYAISKLADLQFMVELNRLATKSGEDIISVAAHPGITQTNLSRHMSQEDFQAALDHFKVKALMPAWQGALPALFAATSPTVKSGDYYGPDGEFELIGYPGIAELSAHAVNETQGKRLWRYAQAATGLNFPEIPKDNI